MALEDDGLANDGWFSITHYTVRYGSKTIAASLSTQSEIICQIYSSSSSSSSSSDENSWSV